MHAKIAASLHKLSSKRVFERKSAIRELITHMADHEAYLARLSLQYVAEHDPCYTVRNIARQAFYRIGPPPKSGVWERAHAF